VHTPYIDIHDILFLVRLRVLGQVSDELH